MASLIARTAGELTARPLSQAANLLAIGLTAFLAGLFLLVLFNVESHLVRSQSRIDFQIYLKPDTSGATAETAWKQLRSFENFQGLSTYTPDEALRELGNTLKTDLTWLGSDNPLPHTGVAQFAIPAGQADLPQQLRAKLAGLPGVERVSASPLQMESARTWAAIGRTAAWVLVALLALTAGLLTAHTVRQSLYAKAAEIDILRLVGATEAYIRLPLVLSNAVLGFMGGLLALGLLKAVQLAAHGAVQQATALAAGVDFLPLPYAAGLPLAMGCICALASLLTAR